MNNALIIVDAQNDFIDGTLPVPGAEEILFPICDLAKDFELVIATQDWHPFQHISFVANGGSWPEHCVQGSIGAKLRSDINKVADVIVRKGTNKHLEAYSGFSGTCLHQALTGVDHLVVCGLAADYCVKQTAIDARRFGFSVTVPLDLCRGVDPEATAEAIEVMKTRGVVVV